MTKSSTLEPESASTLSYTLPEPEERFRPTSTVTYSMLRKQERQRQVGRNPRKRLNFFLEDDEDDEDSDTISTVVTSTPKPRAAAAATPRPTSVAVKEGRQRYPVTLSDFGIFEHSDRAPASAAGEHQEEGQRHPVTLFEPVIVEDSDEGDVPGSAAGEYQQEEEEEEEEKENKKPIAAATPRQASLPFEEERQRHPVTLLHPTIVEDSDEGEVPGSAAGEYQEEEKENEKPIATATPTQTGEEERRHPATLLDSGIVVDSDEGEAPGSAAGEHEEDKKKKPKAAAAAAATSLSVKEERQCQPLNLLDFGMAEDTDEGEAPGSAAGEQQVEEKEKKKKTKTEAVAATAPFGSGMILKKLDKYRRDLTSLAGGLKSEKAAAQHYTQVKRFVEHKNIRNIDEFSAENINQFIIYLMKAHQPGTVRSYVCSLQNFVRYACPKDVEHTTDFLSRSLKALASLQQQRQVEVADEAAENLPTEEQRQYVIRGRYIHTVYKDFKDDPAMAFTDFRNAIVLFLIVSNGLRVSSIINLQISKVRKATKTEVEGVRYRTIAVTKHKTSASRGAQMIVLKARDYRLLVAMADYVEAVFGLGDDRLVRQNSGAPITTQSLVNYYLQQAWQRCGGLEQFGRLNARLNRQAMTCQGRARDPQQAKAIAAHLKHRESTADKFYHVYRDKQDSAKTVHFLNQPHTESDQPPGEDSESREDDSDQQSEAAPGPFSQIHLFPSIPEGLTREKFVVDIKECYTARPFEDYLSEALKYRHDTRAFVERTSYMSIHRALEKELTRYNINLNLEILQTLDIGQCGQPMDVQTTLMSIIAVEIGRFYGCGDDVTRPLYRERPAERPERPAKGDERLVDSQRPPAAAAAAAAPAPAPAAVQPKRKKLKRPRKEEFPLVMPPKTRKRFDPDVADRVQEAYRDVIEQNVTEGRRIKMDDAREHADLFPEFTHLQLRDKLVNLAKKWKREQSE